MIYKIEKTEITTFDIEADNIESLEYAKQLIERGDWIKRLSIYNLDRNKREIFDEDFKITITTIKK